MKRREVLKLRGIIEKATQFLDDETALNAVALHPAWVSEKEYAVNFKVRFDGVLYRCLTAHRAQEGWTPANAPSLWAEVLVEEGQILPWQQPDSTNPYGAGDKVLHNGSVWVSDVDNNVWEPGVYGWSKE